MGCPSSMDLVANLAANGYLDQDVDLKKTIQTSDPSRKKNVYLDFLYMICHEVMMYIIYMIVYIYRYLWIYELVMIGYLYIYMYTHSIQVYGIWHTIKHHLGKLLSLTATATATSGYKLDCQISLVDRGDFLHRVWFIDVHSL